MARASRAQRRPRPAPTPPAEQQATIVNLPERKPVAPMPRSFEQVVAGWKLKRQRTLNDLVNDCFMVLCTNEQFLQYLDAVYDEQAITGSLSFDNYEATKMILDYAKERGMEELTRQKPASINKALNVVLRRYGRGRKERRYMVAGQVLAAPTDGE